MQKTIFHVHSFRCKHASDESDEDYIKKAIELGAEKIVFTDHAPFPENPFHYRMRIEELPEYTDTLQELKKKYINEICVEIGLEIEYIPIYEDYYASLLNDYKLDFLLLGQHFSLMSDGRYTFDLKDKSEEHKRLAEGMIDGMRTGLFRAVAHPDQIFRRLKVWNDDTNAIANEIKLYAKVNSVVLEQNISNMFEKKRKHLYWKEFWEDVDSDLVTIYGVDAHSISELEENYRKQLLLQEER